MNITMTPGWQDEVYAATDEYLAEIGPRISASAKVYCPKRTGRLAESIEFHMSGHSAIVAAHTSYAAFVELGTRPHIISAKNAKALAFMMGGETVFATSVHHPGTHPEPYLRPALYQVRAL